MPKKAIIVDLLINASYMNKILISAVENEEGDMGLTFKAVHEEVPEEKPETPVGAGSSGEGT